MACRRFSMGSTQKIAALMLTANFTASASPAATSPECGKSPGNTELGTITATPKTSINNPSTRATKYSWFIEMYHSRRKTKRSAERLSAEKRKTAMAQCTGRRISSKKKARRDSEAQSKCWAMKTEQNGRASWMLQAARPEKQRASTKNMEVVARLSRPSARGSEVAAVAEMPSSIKSRATSNTDQTSLCDRSSFLNRAA
mmetsp:Transcript_85103/g.231009  ORF Transcript_85103/g.231009 Transcript_85103/m.231009 type:complete len:200 (+) Transcript_85103:547-1146(+)